MCRTQPNKYRPLLGRLLAQVLEASTLLKVRTEGSTAPLEMLLLVVEGMDACCRLDSDGVSATASVQDVHAHDLCTHDPGVSDCLLARWREGGAQSFLHEHCPVTVQCMADVGLTCSVEPIPLTPSVFCRYPFATEGAHTIVVVIIVVAAWRLWLPMTS